MKTKHIIISTILLIILIPSIIYFSIQPSNERDWVDEAQTLPYAEFDNINPNIVHIYNIRNSTYKTTSDYNLKYFNKTYNIDELESLSFMVEPFSQFYGAAHTFLSYGFENGEYLVISVEIRKEKGEHFSAQKGLFKQFELMYVIGTEDDLIKLRSNYRNDSVFLYPVNTTKENIQIIFTDMLNRTNKLKDSPEFYNTLTSTCTTNIVKHINKISPRKIPWSYKIIMPGYSDELAYDIDLIVKQGTLEETREYYKINERALKYADSPDFSKKIREYE